MAMKECSLPISGLQDIFVMLLTGKILNAPRPETRLKCCKSVNESSVDSADHLTESLIQPGLDWFALTTKMVPIVKDFMKQTLIVLAFLLLVFRIHAALVEYSYTGKETFLGNGGEEMITYSGIMMYDTVSSNVTFVDWRSDKTYRVSTNTNLHFTVVAGPNSKTYTVITESSSGADTNGFYHLNDYMISGQNATLSIAANTTYEFPTRFAGSNNRNLTPDEIGNERLETWGEQMTFSASRTQSDNNKNLSTNEVANALITELQAKGYTGP